MAMEPGGVRVFVGVGNHALFAQAIHFNNSYGPLIRVAICLSL